ncbi:MAG: hypothetical protein ACE15E_13720 [Acidobacteriota bacterium]
MVFVPLCIKRLPQAFEEIGFQLPPAVNETEDAVKVLRSPERAVVLFGQLPELRASAARMARVDADHADE